jgi:hypothetical protein
MKLAEIDILIQTLTKRTTNFEISNDGSTIQQKYIILVWVALSLNETVKKSIITFGYSSTLPAVYVVKYIVEIVDYS